MYPPLLSSLFLLQKMLQVVVGGDAFQLVTHNLLHLLLDAVVVLLHHLLHAVVAVLVCDAGEYPAKLFYKEPIGFS